MLALSIQQPWAWAIFSEPPARPGHLRAKDVENRTWPAEHRGWFQVHAGRKYDEAGGQILWDRYRMRHPDLPLGGIIGMVRLVGVVRDFRSPWFAGPYGFLLADPYPLPFMPCRGSLKFFDPLNP